MAKGGGDKKTQNDAEITANPRVPEEGYPFFNSLENQQLQVQNDNKLSMLKRGKVEDWVEPDALGDDSGPTMKRNLLKVQEIVTGAQEWVPFAKLCDEGKTQLVHGKRKRMDFSVQGFLGKVNESNTLRESCAQFGSFLVVTQWMEKMVRDGNYLWESIQRLGANPENGSRYYGVKLFYEGEWQLFVVDDLVPLEKAGDFSSVMMPCWIVEEKPEQRQEEQGNEEQQKEEEEEDTTPPTKRGVLWPTLLYKVFYWFQQSLATETGSSILGGKFDFFNISNHWGQIKSTRNGFEFSDQVPRDIDWKVLRKPMEADHFFKSWEHFHLAKAEATEKEDKETLALYEESEREAMEKKAAYEQELIEQELAEAAKESAEDGSLTKRSKKKKSKRKGKTKKFVPFNQVSFTVANTNYANALAEAQKIFARQSQKLVDTIRIGGKSVNVDVRVIHKSQQDFQNVIEEVAEPASSTQPPAKGGKKGKDANSPPVEEQVPGESPIEKALRRVKLIGEAEWVSQTRSLISNTYYAVCEANETSIRLCGNLGTPSGPLDWSVMETFWIDLVDLKTLLENDSEFEFETFVWQTFATSNFVTLHDRPDFATGARSSRSKCTALFLRQGQKVEQGNDDTVEVDNVVPVTVQLIVHDSLKPEEDGETLTSLNLTVSGDSIENDLVFQNSAFTETKCSLYEKGLEILQIEIDPRKPIIIELESQAGASVVFSCEDKDELVLLPILDAWKELENGPSHLETVTKEFAETPTQDWNVIGRYRLEVGENQGYTVSGQIDLNDSRLNRHLRVLKLDHESGEVERVDSQSMCNGQWISPLNCTSNVQDFILVLLNTNNGSEMSLPAGSFTFRIITTATEIVSFTDMEGSVAKQLFRGCYIRNSHHIIFRDYIDVIPQCFQMRFQVNQTVCQGQAYVPFQLQLVVQDVEAQATSGIVANGDQVVAESKTKEPGQNFVELFWIPSSCFEIDNKTQKLVLQAKFESDPRVFGRRPYWEKAQLEQGEEANDEIPWELFLSTNESGGVTLRRETAWENAVRALQRKWETEQPGRLENAQKLRKSFCENNQEQAEDDERKLYRAQLKQKLAQHVDETGALYVERCPVPRSDDERYFLDAFAPETKAAEHDEEGKGEEEEGQQEKVATSPKLVSAEKRDQQREQLKEWLQGVNTMLPSTAFEVANTDSNTKKKKK